MKDLMKKLEKGEHDDDDTRMDSGKPILWEEDEYGDEAIEEDIQK